MNASVAGISDFTPDEDQGWLGRLRLRLRQSASRTILAEREHSGPLTVQRPFYPEGDGTCHVYLLHPPGGVVAGDRLELDVSAEPLTSALFTTPAATKFYRSNGLTARQKQTLSIAPGASLEWLPQETLLFDGARAELTTHVKLAAGARFIGCEVLVFGRPAADERYDSGDFIQRFEIWRAGEPLWIERLHVAGNSEALRAKWGFGGHCTVGTLVALGGHDESGLGRVLAMKSPELAVTSVGELILCRYLGASATHARRLLMEAWRLLRPVVCGRAAVAPRIWST